MKKLVEAGRPKPELPGMYGDHESPVAQIEEGAEAPMASDAAEFERLVDAEAARRTGEALRRGQATMDAVIRQVLLTGSALVKVTLEKGAFKVRLVDGA